MMDRLVVSCVNTSQITGPRDVITDFTLGLMPIYFIWFEVPTSHRRMNSGLDSSTKQGEILFKSKQSNTLPVATMLKCQIECGKFPLFVLDLSYHCLQTTAALRSNQTHTKWLGSTAPSLVLPQQLLFSDLLERCKLVPHAHIWPCTNYVCLVFWCLCSYIAVFCLLYIDLG